MTLQKEAPEKRDENGGYPRRESGSWRAGGYPRGESGSWRLS